MRTEGKLSVYESIMARIKRDIALGVIAEDERLPSCRELAMEMGINPNTVQRAYSELEAEGLIRTIPKKGVYAGKRAAVTVEEAAAQLAALKAAGATRELVLAAVDAVYPEDKGDKQGL